MKKYSPPFTETVKNLQASVLTARIGAGLDYTVAEMAEGIGENERQIYSYKGGENMMPLPKFLMAAKFLGADFLEPFLQLIGMTGAHVIGRVDDNPNAAIADLSACIASISKALADGAIDHREAVSIVMLLQEAENQAREFRLALVARFGQPK